MVVWHDDWRDDAQLDRLHTYYLYWLAFFYAKHLRRGDLRHPAIRDAAASTGGSTARHPSRSAASRSAPATRAGSYVASPRGSAPAGAAVRSAARAAADRLRGHEQVHRQCERGSGSSAARCGPARRRWSVRDQVAEREEQAQEATAHADRAQWRAGACPACAL